MKDTDCAWLAGIWDGEGTISLYRSVWKRKESPKRRLKNHEYEPERYRALMAVVNSHRPLGERIHAMLIDLGVKHYFLQKVRSRSSFSQKEMWTIHVMSHVSCRTLLACLRPYLFVKKEQADALWRWCEIAQTRDPHLRYTDEQRAIAASLRQRAPQGNPQPSQAGAAQAG